MPSAHSNASPSTPAPTNLASWPTEACDGSAFVLTAPEPVRALLPPVGR